MSEIYAQALAQNIEKDYVYEVIRRRGLLPDASVVDLEAEAWPWPVRIYTLGRFSLVCQNKAVAFTGKAQKKPLDLLKAIVAFGGRDVSEVQLMETLWPDSDGDMAKQNLKSTVHRLRKLLEADVLQWNEGKLSLDAQQCWVDVWALERFLNIALQDLNSDTIQLNHFMQQLEQYYSGTFLSGEDESYVLGLRERLRSKLLRLLPLLAEGFMRKGEYGAAINVYQKGLEIEPLTEQFYHGIMLCQQAMGHITEVLVTYEHYRQIVQNVLGMPPSEEISALANTLRQQQRS